MNRRHGLRAFIVLIALAPLTVGCGLYRWEPKVLAAGWSTGGNPVLLEWVGRGFRLMGNQPLALRGEPTSGNYRAVMSDGSKVDFSLDSLDYCFWPSPPLDRHFSVIDESRILVVGRKCGTAAGPTYALMYDLKARRVGKMVELPGDPDHIRKGVTASDDLSLLAVYDRSGIEITDLTSGSTRRYLTGRRVRYARFSHDARKLAALVKLDDSELSWLGSNARVSGLGLQGDARESGGGGRQDKSHDPAAVLVMDPWSGTIEDVLRPAGLGADEFSDASFSDMRGDETMLVQVYPHLRFCFGRDNATLVQVDAGVWRLPGHELFRTSRPECSPDGGSVGFLIGKAKIYWLKDDLKTLEWLSY